MMVKGDTYHEKRFIILITLCALCFGVTGCSKKIDDKVIFEDTPVFTTSNGTYSSFYYRFYSRKALGVIGSNATSSNPNVKVELGNIDDVKTNVYKIKVKLKTPPGKSKFNITFTINGKKYVLKNIQHINFDHKEVPNTVDSIHSEIAYSSPKDFPTEYNNPIDFSGPADSYEYKVYGEKIKKIEKISSNSIVLKTEIKKPNISSITYIVNGEEYSLCNTYHAINDSYYSAPHK